MSEQRKFLIDELQPTDKLRQEVISYLQTLSPEEIQKKHGFPQIWLVKGKLLISDGNNRTADLLRRGHLEIRTDYNEIRTLPQGYCFFIDILTARAKELQSQGIYSVKDLWQI